MIKPDLNRPHYIASFFDTEEVLKKYGSHESFLFHLCLDYEAQVEPFEQIIFYV